MSADNESEQRLICDARRSDYGGAQEQAQASCQQPVTSCETPRWQDNNTLILPRAKMIFARKAYALLTLQLLVTAAVVAIFTFSKAINAFLLKHWWISFVALGVILLFMILSMYTSKIRHASTKWSLLIMFISTCCLSLSVATVATYYTVYEVLMAFTCTITITIGVMLFTFQNKWEFTFGVVLILVFALFVTSFGSLCGFYYGFGWNCRPVIMFEQEIALCYNAWYLVGCGFFTLVYVFFLAIHVMWMMEDLSATEYIYASLKMYIDIIAIFLLILSGGRR